MDYKKNFQQIPLQTTFTARVLDDYLRTIGLIAQSTIGSKYYPSLWHMKMNEYQFDTYNNIGIVGRFDIPAKYELDDSIIDYQSWPMYKDGQFMQEGDNLVASIRKYLVVGTVEKIHVDKKPQHGYYTVYGIRIRDKEGAAWSINRDSGNRYTAKEALKLPLG